MFFISISALASLAGWLSAAFTLNVIDVATSTGLMPAADQPATALSARICVGVLGVAISTLVGRCRYDAALAWGLVGVFVAEVGKQAVTPYVCLGGAMHLLSILPRSCASCAPARATRSRRSSGRPYQLADALQAAPASPSGRVMVLGWSGVWSRRIASLCASAEVWSATGLAEFQFFSTPGSVHAAQDQPQA